MLEEIFDLFVDDEFYITDDGDFASAIQDIVADIDNFSK